MFRKLLKALGILKDKENQSPIPSPAKQDDQAHLSHSALESILIEVGQEFEDPKKFSAAAQDIASKYTFRQLERLSLYLHDPPAAPEELKDTLAKYGILGVWLNVCQNTIFEILYQYKEAAIPTLNGIMFGEYDWTQYKAIDVLCRFAKEGIRSDGIIEDIGKHLLGFRYETVFEAIESLAKIENHKSIPKIFFNTFEDYRKDDPIDGLIILQYLAVNYPKQAKKKLAFVQSIAKGKMINKSSKTEYKFSEEDQITAAIFALQLEDNNQEIKDLLDHWETFTEDPALKDMIIQFKKNPNS